MLSFKCYNDIADLGEESLETPVCVKAVMMNWWKAVNIYLTELYSLSIAYADSWWGRRPNQLWNYRIESERMI